MSKTNLHFTLLCFLLLMKYVYSEGPPCTGYGNDYVNNTAVGDAGVTAVFNCVVNALVMNFRWRHTIYNNEPTNITSGDKYLIGSGGRMDVFNVNASDEGLYHCIPEPKPDIPTTDLFCLTVIGYPVLIDCSVNNNCHRNISYNGSFDIVVQFINMFAGYSNEHVPVSFSTVQATSDNIRICQVSSGCSGDDTADEYPNATYHFSNVVTDGVYTVSASISTSSPAFSTAMSYFVTVNVTSSSEVSDPVPSPSSSFSPLTSISFMTSSDLSVISMSISSNTFTVAASTMVPSRTSSSINSTAVSIIAGIVAAVILVLILILVLIFTILVIYRSRKHQTFAINGVNSIRDGDGTTVGGNEYDKELRELDNIHNSKPRIV